MKKTFKKFTTTVMTVASLVVSMTGISANAEDVLRSFGSDATAYLSVSSTSVYGYTSVKTSKKLSVTLYNYINSDGKVTGTPTVYTDSGTKITAQIWGEGFTFSNSSHVAGNTQLTPDFAVWN